MRLAMLSWRYLDHPAAGGAEVLTHEIMRRLVAGGHEVTCFTAAYPGSTDEGELDGVRLVRKGRQWTVHFWAWRWLRARRPEFDRVIDQINTIPFLTPMYVEPERRRFYICQLAREYWWRETRGLFRIGAPIGYLAESSVLRLYRTSEGVTISDSTRKDLVGLGIPGDNLSIIPMAVSFEPLDDLERKLGGRRVVIVGRLTPAKFVEEGVRAFAEIQRHTPDATLDVVGGGDPRYRDRLEKLVRSLGLTGVTFHGRVSEERKLELLEQAHIHVFTSHREGWGLTVTEAAAMGTPSIGYAVPGVQDSIGDPDLLAPCGDHEAIARIATGLLGDPERYEQVRRSAWKHARTLSYDETAKAFAAALEVPLEDLRTAVT